MEFLYPTFLWALLALAVPIIIHLFFFRRFKKVYFTNVRFLKEIKEETSSRNKLRNLLVLLMRLLALLFLVLAFAQPFLPKNRQAKMGQKSLSIFVDNSFSMNALSADVPLIDLAKDRARQIVEAHTQEDRFQILTHDLEGQHQRLVSQEDALSFIDEIEASPSVQDLSVILARQQQVLDQSHAHPFIYWISDFQRDIIDVDALTDTSVEYHLVPLQAVREKNISIDSCWFEAPVPMLDQANTLIVKISNHSDEAIESARLSLQYEGQEKPLGTIDIAANGIAYDTVNMSILRTGWHAAELRITDYPVQFDDTYKFGFQVAETTRVLSIHKGSPNRFLVAAFNGLAHFDLTNQALDQIQYATFSGYDLIVLDDLDQISSGLSSELKTYVESGGNLLIFPGKRADINSYNALLSSLGANRLEAWQAERHETRSLNIEAFVFRDVFERQSRQLKLPVTEGRFELSNFQRAAEERLLVYKDGKSFISKYALDNGLIYLCAAPLDDSVNDLVRNAEIFIPMLFKMAISKAVKVRLAYTIGRDNILEVDNRVVDGEMVYTIRSGINEFIPGHMHAGPKVLLDVHNQIKEADYYTVELDKESLDHFAFNYDRKESNLDYVSEAELGERFGDRIRIWNADSNHQFAQALEDGQHGLRLWRWCLILCLLFLAAETFILRFWKT